MSRSTTALYLKREHRYTLEMTYAPDDWEDIDGWDLYWKESLSNDFSRDFDSIGFAGGKILGDVEDWKTPNLRFLCAGNGISLEPYALAHRGFEVVVVDISAVACQFVKQTTPTPELLAQFFPAPVEEFSYVPRRLDLKQSLARVEKEYVPGGSVTVLEQSIFSHQPTEKYHGISSIRAFQGFIPQKQSQLAKLFFEWLVPRGHCFVDTMNVVAQRHSIEAHFINAGFYREAPEFVEWSNERWREKEAAKNLPDAEQRIATAQKKWEDRWAKAHNETNQRLAAGEKIAVFCHAFG